MTVDLPDLDVANLSEQGEGEYCENCGRPMVLKKGRFGTFFACTGYPDCKTTKQIGGTQKKPDVQLEEKCPVCGSNMVLKTGRFGEFTACSNYPDLQAREAENHRHEVSGVQRGRSGGAPLQARQDVLRLQPLAGLQLRDVGQASAGEVSRVRRSLLWWRSG